MTKLEIGLIKWFARQNSVVKLSLLISGLVVSTALLTNLLIENYKDRQTSDATTIKDLRTQMDVQAVVCAAESRRKDSIHIIEKNNERLATKAFLDQVIKDNDELKKELRARIAEYKNR